MFLFLDHCILWPKRKAIGHYVFYVFCVCYVCILFKNLCTIKFYIFCYILKNKYFNFIINLIRLLIIIDFKISLYCNFKKFIHIKITLLKAQAYFVSLKRYQITTLWNHKKSLRQQLIVYKTRFSSPNQQLIHCSFLLRRRSSSLILKKYLKTKHPFFCCSNEYSWTPNKYNCIADCHRLIV